MARLDPPLEQALSRWREKGLVSGDLAELLRAEAMEAHARRSRDRGRLWVSAVGAAAAFGAVVLFATEVWPALTIGGRAFLLAAGTLLTYGIGAALQRAPRWSAAGEFLRVTGLALVLVTVIYSTDAWGLGSLGARGWGVFALLAAAGAAWVTWYGPTRMAVGHVVFILPYLAAFLVMTAGLDSEPVMWALDGAWAVGLVAVGVSAREGGDQERRQRRLAVLITGAWIGFVLLFFTGAEVLRLSDHTVWPMDAWMITMAAVTWWAASRAPTDAEAELLERHLALCIPAAVALAVFTVAETLGWPGELWLVAGAAVASLGLWWGLEARNTLGLASAAGSLIVVIWIYTVDRSEVVLAAVALALTAALFFWVGSRIRST